jgi:hypothetical protein
VIKLLFELCCTISVHPPPPPAHVNASPPPHAEAYAALQLPLPLAVGFELCYYASQGDRMGGVRDHGCVCGWVDHSNCWWWDLHHMDFLRELVSTLGRAQLSLLTWVTTSGWSAPLRALYLATAVAGGPQSVASKVGKMASARDLITEFIFNS